MSLLLALVYLAGGIYALLSLGRPDLIDPVLIGWFLVFLVCAALMFGSIFLALGSACSDLKDAQSMLQPAMMLVILAYLGSFVVMRAPDSPLAVGPVVLPDDDAVRDDAAHGDAAGPAALAGAARRSRCSSASTVFVVWAAGRIFRVGLLMQGKAPNLPELMKWIRQ